MSKVLISPLGTGRRNEALNREERDYFRARYRIDKTDYPQREFVASVLYDHFNLDDIYFIGTVKSIWERVYEYFCQANDHPTDEDYWLQLAQTIEGADRNTSPDSLDLQPVERAISPNSKCILIEYGLTESEIWNNLDKIVAAIYSLNEGDEIYLDITHSFRSLSLFQFLAIDFIKDLLAEKRITIAGVYYGMLDVQGELSYAPIVDLYPMVEMMDWVKGTYSLKNFGNGYLISQLLEKREESETAQQIRKLSQAINTNYTTTIQQQSSSLKNRFQDNETQGPFQYVRPILKDVAERFARSGKKQKASQYQLNLAGWYFANERYATGYIALAEAVISYLCEYQGQDPEDDDCRDTIRETIKNDKRLKRTELVKLYQKHINPIRNNIAHASLSSKKGAGFDKAVNRAEEFHQKVEQIFNGGHLNL